MSSENICTHCRLPIVESTWLSYQDRKYHEVCFNRIMAKKESKLLPDPIVIEETRPETPEHEFIREVYEALSAKSKPSIWDLAVIKKAEELLNK